MLFNKGNAPRKSEVPEPAITGSHIHKKMRRVAMSTTKSSVSLVSLAMYLLCATALTAQIKSATITGSIKDPSGALIAAADVSITNEETGVATTAKTSESGSFTAPYLSAGRYSVTIKKTGFAPYQKTGINVGTSET